MAHASSFSAGTLKFTVLVAKSISMVPHAWQLSDLPWLKIAGQFVFADPSPLSLHWQKYSLLPH
jgi:hypothetical protein